MEIIENYINHIVTLILILYGIRGLSERLLANIAAFLIATVSFCSNSPDYFILVSSITLLIFNIWHKDKNLINVIFLFFLFKLENPALFFILFIFYLIKLLMFKDYNFEKVKNLALLFWTGLLGAFIVVGLGSYNFIDNFSYYYYLFYLLFIRILLNSEFEEKEHGNKLMGGLIFPLIFAKQLAQESMSNYNWILIIISSLMLIEIVKNYKNIEKVNYINNIVFYFSIGYLIINGASDVGTVFVINAIVFYVTNNRFIHSEFKKLHLTQTLILFLSILLPLLLLETFNKETYIMKLVFFSLIILPTIIWRNDSMMLVEHNSQFLRKINLLEVVIVAFMFIVMTIAVKIHL